MEQDFLLSSGGDKREQFRAILDRLGSMSVHDYYNPYLEFDWPESLPKDALWMSPELMSVAGTPAMKELSERELFELSRWESVNFYSLNVHGIRELLIAVIQRIHTRGFELPSEFFHHFVGEENEHMWFFARFCLNYAGKIYPNNRIRLSTFDDPLVESFLVFSRILIFEEIVDQYNAKMADDERLHATIQQVNRIHHQDESRHIAFGRKMVSLLYDDLREKSGEENRHDIEDYLRRYMAGMVTAFYNPTMYRDAGLSSDRVVWSDLLANESRREFHSYVLKRSTDFFVKEGVFEHAIVSP